MKRIFKGKYILMAAVVLLLSAAFLFFLQRGLPVSACRVERGEVVDRFTETGVVRGGEDRAKEINRRRGRREARIKGRRRPRDREVQRGKEPEQ